MNLRRNKRTFLLAAAVAALSLAAGCGSDDAPPADVSIVTTASRDAPAAGANETAVMDVTITYRQRIALPKDATVVVNLVDLSRGAAPGTVVSVHRFETQSQVPIRFLLPYDPSRVASQNAYGIEAQILVDGALWFVSDQPAPVLTRGAPANAQIVVRPAPQPG